jgi:excisionase family DNA binding protein
LGLMLTTNDAAKRLNVSAEHVRKLCRAGILKSYDVSIRDGRATYRIDERELEAYAKRRCVVATAHDERVRRWRADRTDKNS